MFSSFQVYVKNNIFKIPTNILLPEDKVRELCSEVAWLCYSHVIKIPWLGNLIFLVCFVGKLEVIGWILVNQKAFLFALISSASYTVKSLKTTCSSGIGLMMDKTHLSNIKIYQSQAIIRRRKSWHAAPLYYGHKSQTSPRWWTSDLPQEVTLLIKGH